MEQKDCNIKNLHERTDAKLRYACVHLNELESMISRCGDDFERAHTESFLYHLLGVRDAFLAELNIYYEANLPNSDVTPGNLRNSLKNKGQFSPELAELHQLENDKGSWFCQAKNMRDHSTHNVGVRRNFHVGGEYHGKVWLHEPESGELIQHDYICEFRDWYMRMYDLIEKLRTSALRKAGRH